MSATIALALLLPIPLMAEVQWSPVIRMGELFPSYIIATATAKPPTNNIQNLLGARRGQVGVKASSRSGNAKIRVVVSSTRLIKESSISATSDSSKRVSCQHIRLIGDALNNQQANCVEGSVLFTSILKKTGVISDLVLVPHHCFVCVYLDKERQIPLFIETTMLDRTVRQSKEFEEGSPLAPVNQAKAGHEVSFNTFVAAQASAYKTFHSFDNDPEREAKRKLINISDCRKMGITPLRNPLPTPSRHSS